MPTDFTPKDGQLRRWDAEKGDWEWVDPPRESQPWPGMVFFVTIVLALTWLLSLLIVRVTS